jgi:FkbM family methyltransferase
MNEYKQVIKEKTTIVPKTILEIGSRDGHDSNTLKNFFGIKNENVWVVEPNPNQVVKIKKDYPQFNIVEKAIFNENKQIEFNCVEDENFIGISSLFDRVDNFYNNVKTKKIIVESITGTQLMEMIDTEIDLCKIDVEGLTYEVIESFKEKINLIKSIHVECEHVEIWKNQKLFFDMHKLLTDNNFKMEYFTFVAGGEIQSDSIWVNRKYLK